MRSMCKRRELIEAGAIGLFVVVLLLLPTSATSILPPPVPHGDPDPWPSVRYQVVAVQEPGSVSTPGTGDDGTMATCTGTAVAGGGAAAGTAGTVAGATAADRTVAAEPWLVRLESAAPFWLQLLLWR